MSDLVVARKVRAPFTLFERHTLYIACLNVRDKTIFLCTYVIPRRQGNSINRKYLSSVSTLISLVY